VTLGGSAEYTLLGAEPGEGTPSEGGRFTPTGRAEGHVAVQLGSAFELGGSVSVYLPESNASVLNLPLELDLEPLLAGSIDTRVFLERRYDTSISVGLRFSQLRYSWDYQDRCTGDCDFELKTGGGSNESTLGVGFYVGVGMALPLNDRIRVLVGTSFELLPYLKTSYEGEKTCTVLGCEGKLPPKPPEPSAGAGFIVYTGMDFMIVDGVRARFVLQPIAYQPWGDWQYFLAQGGVEFVF
jgi:hypothetical protein